MIENQTADIESVAKLIAPAVKKAQETKTKNLLELAIKTNALNMKNFVENSASLKQLIQDKKIEVYAAYYNLESGIVELINEEK